MKTVSVLLKYQHFSSLHIVSWLCMSQIVSTTQHKLGDPCCKTQLERGLLYKHKFNIICIYNHITADILEEI